MQPAIPTDLVRHELDAVCGSAAFVRSPQHQRLLRYLVQELLADRLANLREIHLGVHIFRRAAARFDPARRRFRIPSHPSHQPCPRHLIHRPR